MPFVSHVGLTLLRVQALQTEFRPGIKPGPGPSEERLARVTAMFVGLGGVFYGLASSTQIIDQVSISGLPWTIIASVLIFGSAATMAVAARWLPFRIVFWSIVFFVAAYFVAMILWIPMHSGGKIGTGLSLWISYSPGLTAVALAAIAGWQWCVLVSVLIVVLSRALTRMVDYNALVPFLPELFLNISFVCVFALAINSFVRTGRSLDRTADQARRQAALTASVQARDSERRRFDALVHDGVLATLLAAAKSGGQIGSATSRQATETLAELRRIRSGPDLDRAVTPAAALASIRSAVEIAHEDAIFTAAIDEPTVDSIPEIAVEALVAGVTEAVRNVVRHAHASECRVTAECDAGSLSVAVEDDGVGFDPERVPRNRLGLAVSIQGRFADLSGGWSAIEATPGQGTTIRLGWAA